MKRLGVIVFLLIGCLSVLAEVIPPAPPHYFNDYAGLVSPGTADQLNRALENFEKASSSQIWVAIYPTMQSDSSIDDYTVRVARSWGVGQKGKNNGAVLFVFAREHKMFITTGYGLEGALPDVVCKRIVEDEIAPQFKQGRYDAGLTAGVNAMMAAAKGEYKGTGRTVNQSKNQATRNIGQVLFIILFIIFVIFSSRRRGAGFFTGWMLGSGGFGGWGGGGGSGGGGDGGGFSSGGGGSFGGGGAGGSW